MTVRDGDEPRVCYKCQPPHVENCSTCAGWGLTSTGLVFIAASEIENYTRDGWHYVACPECGGTPYNTHLLNEIEIPAERLEVLKP